MKMENTVQQPNFFSQPRRIILTILAIAVLWISFPGNLATLALLAIGILFLFGLKRPVWAMAALLVSQLTVISYMVNTPLVTISLRLLLLVLIGLFILRSNTQNHFQLGTGAKRVIFPVIILIGLGVVSNLINSDFDFAYKDFRTMLVGLLIIIFLPAVTRNLRDLKILCGVAFIGITASAIIAVLQHYQFLGMGQNTLIPGFLWQWGEQLRVPGIAESELELSYVLSIVILAVVGIYLARGVIHSNKWLLGASSMLMGLALYFTYTRSALLALLLGMIALFLFLKTRIRGEIILLVLLLGIVLIEGTGIMKDQYLGGRDQAAQEGSSISRMITWQAGMAIAMDNPVLGIGWGQYITSAAQYADSVDPSLLKWEANRYWDSRTLGTIELHNDFLGMWISYGISALVIYLWLYFTILRNFLHSYQKSSNRFVKGLSVGLAAGLIAYGTNAFYHNVLDTFPLFWILAGFSVATAKVAVKSKARTQILQLPAGASL